jgi:hypothetical protein
MPRVKRSRAPCRPPSIRVKLPVASTADSTLRSPGPRPSAPSFRAERHDGYRTAPTLLLIEFLYPPPGVRKSRLPLCCAPSDVIRMSDVLHHMTDGCKWTSLRPASHADPIHPSIWAQRPRSSVTSQDVKNEGDMDHYRTLQGIAQLRPQRIRKLPALVAGKGAADNWKLAFSSPTGSLPSLKSMVKRNA